MITFAVSSTTVRTAVRKWMINRGTKMIELCNYCINCACYEEEWEYCFRLGTHVPKNGYCENYRNELQKEK